jgi:hypothetical protein
MAALTANLWFLQAPVPLGIPPVGPPNVVGVACDLGQQRWQADNEVPPTLRGALRTLYTPPSTDARLDVTGALVAYAEVPAGSGTYYAILDVQDIRKGTGAATRRLILAPQLFPTPLP